jgi:hypothetical protein
MKIQDIITESPILLERIHQGKEFAQVVAASKRAFANLDEDCQRFITEWETANWDVGKLEAAFKGKAGFCYGEITKAFSPVKALLHQIFGDTITLHRGQRNLSPDQLNMDRTLFSWTFDERVAKDFAGQGKRNLYDIPSVEDIDKAVAQYEKTGFVKFGKYKYKRSQEYPEYAYIYDKNNDLVTDAGEDLRQHLIDDREARIHDNEVQKKRGDVKTFQIKIDDIAWITNNLNSKEFITHINPLKHPETT